MESTFRPVYKADEDTRGGCVATGRQTQWGDKKRVFGHFGAYNFGTFRAEAKVTILRSN